MTVREEKMKELIRQQAADFLSVVSNRQSLITVTNVKITPDMKRAIIGISVFPDTEAEKALHFAKRQRTEFRNMIKSKLRLRSVPMFEFEVDEGEKNRQHLEMLDVPIAADQESETT